MLVFSFVDAWRLQGLRVIVDLFFGVAKFGEIVNGIEHCTLVSNTCIKVVLSSTLINTDAFKNQPF